MKKNVIIKPIISEKADLLASTEGKYSFVVRKDANKVEIGKAFAEMFPGVTYTDVNTMRTPGKVKGRNTRSGYLKGKVSSYKKAIITLAEGEELDIYGAEAQ